MKALLDTSVLVASFYGDHELHQPSLDLFLRFDKRDVCCGAHSLAEVYSSLTGMPGKWRVGGDVALLFLEDVRSRLTLITLDEQEYFEVVTEAARHHLAGGSIFDALLGRCAIKAGAETVYTWNTKHFLRLPPPIPGLVRQPER